MVQGGLCCCLFVSFYLGEGKVWLWSLVYLYVYGGKRGPGDAVWSWDDLCFDHSMIYLLYDGFFVGGGGGWVE